MTQKKNEKNAAVEAEACQKKTPVCKLAFFGVLLLFVVFQVSIKFYLYIL